MPDNGSSSAVLDAPTGSLWDYQVCAVHARHIDVLEERLKELGQEGWELVHVYMPIATEYHCIFRKSIR